jgi:hypothetical protein
MEDVSDVVETFDAVAARTARHKAEFEKGLAQLYEMLPEVRAALLADSSLPAGQRGPKAIEERSRGLIDRAEVSRRTAAAVGRSRKAAES